MAEPPPDASAPPPEAPAREGVDFPFLVAAGIALVAALVLVRNLLPAKQDLADTLRREENLKKEIEALREERGVLEMRERALENDDSFMERELHRQTGMTRPGEFIVR